MKWILYCDGASRGNPGRSGAGALLINEKGEKIPLIRYLGEKTNNQAEYEGLLLGLSELVKHPVTSLEIRADSELMVRQLNGQYKVKNEGLIPLYRQAKEFLKKYPLLSIQHVRREQNTEADLLSNRAIDERDFQN